ncbi:MAG: hypothetical protein AAB847_03045 [Patescibacteria group bacterium]
MKKGERRFSLMGIKCSLYKNEKGNWVIAASLSDRELFNGFLHKLLEDDMLNFSPTDARIHVETRFTNINALKKKLRQPQPLTE